MFRSTNGQPTVRAEYDDITIYLLIYIHAGNSNVYFCDRVLIIIKSLFIWCKLPIFHNLPHSLFL